MNELKQLLAIHNANNEGHRFQEKLANFIRLNSFQTIVETGSGLSSLFVADALNDRGFGKLYSVDPAPWSTIRFTHERVDFIEKCSDEALCSLFLKTGAWDLAISDGNHDIKAQTYEYEFMFACLRPSGFLIADDVSWNSHGAWEKFLSSHELKEHFFGDARLIQKPAHISVYATEAYHKECIALAENAERMWLENGNKNSEIVWDTRV